MIICINVYEFSCVCVCARVCICVCVHIYVCNIFVVGIVHSRACACAHTRTHTHTKLCISTYTNKKTPVHPRTFLQHAATFRYHNVTGSLLLELNKTDIIEDLKVDKFGQRQTLIEEIATLRKRLSRGGPTAARNSSRWERETSGGGGIAGGA